MGLVLSCGLLFAACSWVPLEAYSVQNNATAAIHCVAQNYGKLTSSRYISVLSDTVGRNAAMLQNDVVSGVVLESSQLSTCV